MGPALVSVRCVFRIFNAMGVRAPLFVFMLLLAAAPLSGCGSGSSSGSSSDPSTPRVPTGPLTQASFVKVGNELCVAATRRRGQDLKEAAAGGEGEGGSAEMKSIVETALESVKDLATEL